jgi:general stress protein CsbA
MTEEFENNFLSSWCDECDEQGFYFVENTEIPHWIVHKTCGWEALSAWCENCGMGCAFPINSRERPKKWKCSSCKETRDIPKELYEQSVDLHLETDLPHNVRERLKISDQPFSLFAQVSSLVGVFAIVVGISLIGFEVKTEWNWWLIAIGAFLLVIGFIVGKIHVRKYLSKQRFDN